jgi:hypothetical protein
MSYCNNSVEFYTLTAWVVKDIRKKRLNHPTAVDDPIWKKIRVGAPINKETKERMIRHWNRMKQQNPGLYRDESVLGTTY